jgi:tetratricopeptide (TPR) repeat protein
MIFSKRSLLYFFWLTGTVSFANADSLKNSLNGLVQPDTSYVNRLNKVSSAYRSINLDTALCYARKSISVAKATSYLFGEAQGYKNLGNALFYSGQKDSSFFFLDRSLTLFDQQGEMIKCALVLEDMAGNFQRLGQLDTASHLFTAACARYRHSGDIEKLAGALNNLGMNYSYLQQFDKALHTLLLAARISLSLHKDLTTATILLNLSTLYLQLEEFKEAKYTITKALIIFEKNDHVTGIAASEGVLGNIELIQNNYNEAIPHYLASIELTEKLGDKHRMAKLFINLGSTYFQSGNDTMALRYYQKSLRLSSNIQASKEYGDVLNNLAILYLAQDQADSALYFAEQSLEVLMQVPSPESNHNVYITLSRIHEATNNYDQAYYFLRQAYVLRDSLHSYDKIRAIETVQTQFESEKDKIEISNLRVKNNYSEIRLREGKFIFWLIALSSGIIIFMLVFVLYVRKTKDRQTRHELEQKALRAQMNPHFIFNALHSIQRMYIQGDHERANDYTADFSDLLRRILDNSDKSAISLQEELYALKLYLDIEKLRCRHNISYTIELDPRINEKFIKVPPLIFQPFVENAIWHGILPANRDGNILVKIDLHDEKELACEISDDGIGISSSRKLSDHQSKGIAITEKRIGTSVELTGSEKGGTTVRFQLRVNDMPHGRYF